MLIGTEFQSMLVIFHAKNTQTTKTYNDQSENSRYNNTDDHMHMNAPFNYMQKQLRDCLLLKKALG